MKFNESQRLLFSFIIWYIYGSNYETFLAFAINSEYLFSNSGKLRRFGQNTSMAASLGNSSPTLQILCKKCKFPINPFFSFSHYNKPHNLDSFSSFSHPLTRSYCRRSTIRADSTNAVEPPRKYDFDLFTIGAGSGGVRASRFAANLGASVAICELPFATVSSDSTGGVGGTYVSFICYSLLDCFYTKFK